MNDKTLWVASKALAVHLKDVPFPFAAGERLELDTVVQFRMNGFVSVGKASTRSSVPWKAIALSSMARLNAESRQVALREAMNGDIRNVTEIENWEFPLVAVSPRLSVSQLCTSVQG